MRADICEPDDAEAVARFRAALAELGAVVVDHSWAIGVDVWVMEIGGDEIRIFEDTWSLDLEGPDELVETIRQRMRALAEN